MNTTASHTIDDYYAMLVNLKPDAKIDLIKKLMDSLKPEAVSEIQEKKVGDDVIDRLAGAWQDYGKTAEEIITDIRDSRYFEDEDIKL